ncbi:MAG: asparagine synthase (glutamine-hydrolyzing) [Ferruginibacter sp.]|nr:asparagine synthase (glutamine-hydrolyzing) [Chitinophagaceae bacterium]
MCRIAGILDRSLPTDFIESLVRGMCNVLKPGGPDDEGIYIEEDHHLVLGNRRLSIIDLTPAGHQPMAYADKRYWITYNGELYNYPELKKELIELGCRFSNASDTEVILAAFATWGTNAFKRFNGMFAFALWDAVTSNLYLVRDSSGIKPLYYAIARQGLAFASELKAFRQIPWLQQKNPDWPVYLMAYGHLPEPVTTLQDVYPLEKGTWLQYHAVTGQVVRESFNRYCYLEKISDREEAIGLIKDNLQQAVKRHLLSDAPIGVFLSGGLDSSIIALLANNSEVKLNTVSLYFEQERFSEKKYQDILKNHLSCDHHQHLLREEEFHEYFPSIIETMDLPSCDGINTWFISRLARQSGLKAVLSGIGGDELYGGYPSFRRMKAAHLLAGLPSPILRAGRLPIFKKYRRLVYLSIDGPVGKYLFLRGQFTPNEIAANLGAEEKEIWQILTEHPKVTDIGHMTPQNQASWIETNMYMQNQLLRDCDVMSMAHGLEIRLPFLDVEFIRLSLQISTQEKYKGAGSKQLLIDSFKDILPAAIWNRPKMGFAFPFKDWLRRDQYARHLMGKDINNNFKKFKAGEMHWSLYLTSMLIANHQHA